MCTSIKRCRVHVYGDTQSYGCAQNMGMHISAHTFLQSYKYLTWGSDLPVKIKDNLVMSVI